MARMQTDEDVLRQLGELVKQMQRGEKNKNKNKNKTKKEASAAAAGGKMKSPSPGGVRKVTKKKRRATVKVVEV